MFVLEQLTLLRGFSNLRTTVSPYSLCMIAFVFPLSFLCAFAPLW